MKIVRSNAIAKISKLSNAFQTELIDSQLIALLSICNITYRTPKNIIRHCHRLGAETISVIAHGSTTVLICEFDSTVIVAFRGAHCITDLATIARFWKAPLGSLQAHTGFVDSLNGVRQVLVRELMHCPTSKKVIFTGHSMGGALALLFGTIHAPSEIVTYACPKVSTGDNFKKHFDDIKVTRVTTRTDFVPYTPWRIPYISKFEHIGDRVELSGTLNPLKSHSISEYRSALIELRLNNS